MSKDERIKKLESMLKSAKGSLLSASTAYEILEVSPVANLLPGLKHTKKDCLDTIKDIDELLSE